MPTSSLFGPLVSLVTSILTRADAKQKQAIETLIAIRDAAKETLQYEAWREESDGKRDREREIQISAAWYRVSYLILPYDDDLHRRLQMKGHYWDNPDKWTQFEVDDARIGLTRVVEEADRLLKKEIQKR